MQFRFYLDGDMNTGTEVFDVEGIDDLEETIERDDKVKGLLLKFPTDFTFTGDAYSYIFAKKTTAGFCQAIRLYVTYRCAEKDSWLPLFDGNLFLTDVVFNLNKCEAKVPFEDNGYSAKIFNNRKIIVPLTGRYSKNGVFIGSCPPTLIKLFKPTDPAGTYLVVDTVVYDIFDVFTYLIKWMSDGTIGFVSDYISGFDDDKHIAITTGVNIPYAFAQNVEISFQDFFDEIYKKFNIFFVMENIGGVPTMRIENLDYFFQTPNILRADFIPDLEESFFQASLYSSVEVGENKFANQDPLLSHSLARLPSLTFIKESYALTNNCNIDEVLDLVGKYIADTNLIEEIIVDGTHLYDDDIFFIQYTLSTLLATKSFYATDNVSALPALYNEQLLNSKVLQRFNFHGNVIKYFNTSPDNHFLAEATYDFSPVPNFISFLQQPYQFDDDFTAPNFDTNNNWGNGTPQGNPVSQANSRYTAPNNSTYNFASTIIVTKAVFSSDLTTCNDQFIIRFRRYSAANVLLETKEEIFLSSKHDQLVSVPFTFSTYFYLQATDYVVPEVEVIKCVGAVSSVTIEAGSTIAVNAIAETGGIFYEKPTQDYYSGKYEFEYPISQSIWDQMKASPADSILINIDGANNKRVWISKITRKLKDSLCKFTCISNIANG